MHLPTAAHHLWTHSRSHIQTSTSFNTSCTGLASVAVVISWHVGSGRRGHGARGTLAITATALWIEFAHTVPASPYLILILMGSYTYILAQTHAHNLDFPIWAAIYWISTWN